ncbi:MAG: RNA-binding protein [Candidatus Doudnabacteria bacterium]|nr:RNA-binding protein [Candidatus Doudnabacteria bacterium]
MGKRLYVGNLSYDTTDETLSAKFGEFGELESASVVMDKMSGRSRGFGFVEYASDEDAAKAIEAMDGVDFEGRELKVNEARPREERGNGGGGDFGGNGGGDSW